MPSKPPATPKRSHAAKQVLPRGQWRQRLKELEAFHRRHGHCNVPARYPQNQPLASWVAYVRHQRKVATLAPEIISRLDALGFQWSIRNRSVGRCDPDAMLAALAAFMRKHGHCRVPFRIPEYRSLAAWLTRVRVRRSRLDSGLIERLDALGFDWAPAKGYWQRMVAALATYKAEHGDCNVPKSYADNRPLGRWVVQLRQYRKQGELNRVRIRQLDRLGFEWNPLVAGWEAMYTALAKYRKEHGDCLVSTRSPEHARLGNWVRTQRGRRRRGKLPQERIERLERLGFAWEVPPAARARRG